LKVVYHTHPPHHPQPNDRKAVEEKGPGRWRHSPFSKGGRQGEGGADAKSARLLFSKRADAKSATQTNESVEPPGAHAIVKDNTTGCCPRGRGGTTIESG